MVQDLPLKRLSCLAGRRSVRRPKENDRGFRSASSRKERAEVGIRGEENTILSSRKLEHSFVGRRLKAAISDMDSIVKPASTLQFPHYDQLVSAAIDVRKHRRAGWINLAVEHRFAVWNVTARQHKSYGNVELIALEIGFVVARHHPHVDAEMRAIEAR